MINKIRTTSALGFALFLVANTSFAETVRIPGVVDGFQTKDKDGIVDAALVVPTLSASEVFRFDLDKLLAPNERAKAGPISADVPGNTYIPRQKEKYGWITVTLEKDDFGFYTEKERKDELSALWFSAPFDLLIDASKGNSNPSELLKAAKFRKVGFAGLKDWSQESKINLSLDRELRGLGQARWSRNAAPKGSSDMIVTFQNTPANRWAVGGFAGNPAQSSVVSSVDGLPPRLKVLAIRSTFVGEDVVSAEGWIVEAERTSKIQFTGLPTSIKGASIVSKKVTWKNPGVTGWMGVVLQPQGALISHDLPSLFDGLFPIMRIIPTITSNATITWVDPRAEEFTLPASYTSADKVTLVCVGTSKVTPAPQEGEVEPQLFTFAESLRTIVVK